MDPNLEVTVDPNREDVRPGESADDSADESWVHVAAFRDLPAAHLAAGSLEAHGLTPRLTDEFTVGADWLISSAIGGVGILVPASQAEAAVAALAEEDLDDGDAETGLLVDVPEELRHEDEPMDETPYFRKRKRSTRERAALGIGFMAPEFLPLAALGIVWTRLRDGFRRGIRDET